MEPAWNGELGEEPSPSQLLVLLPELTSLAEVDVFFGGFFTQPGASTFFFPDRSRSPQFDVVD